MARVNVDTKLGQSLCNRTKYCERRTRAWRRFRPCLFKKLQASRTRIGAAPELHQSISSRIRPLVYISIPSSRERSLCASPSLTRFLFLVFPEQPVGQVQGSLVEEKYPDLLTEECKVVKPDKVLKYGTAGEFSIRMPEPSRNRRVPGSFCGLSCFNRHSPRGVYVGLNPQRSPAARRSLTVSRS